MKTKLTFLLFLVVGCTRGGIPTSELKSSDPGVRAHAAERIGNLGRKGSYAIPDLILLFEDSHAEVKFQAIQAMNKIGSPAHKALMDCLKKRNKSFRLGAIEALGQPDPRFEREFSAEEDKVAFPVLVKAFHDEELEVRLAAVKSMVPVCLNAPQKEEALKAFNGILESKDEAVYPAAATAIGMLARRGKNDSSFRRSSLLLVKLLRLDVKSKRAGLWALAELGTNSRDAIPFVVETLKDGDRQVKEDAYETLRRLRDLRKDAAPFLRKLVSEKNLDARTREFANNLLSME